MRILLVIDWDEHRFDVIWCADHEFIWTPSAVTRLQIAACGAGLIHYVGFDSQHLNAVADLRFVCRP